MSVEPKVIAAISSAIGFYLQAEQEALLAQRLKSARTAAAGHEQPICPSRKKGRHGHKVDLADALAPLGDSAFDLSGFDWSTVEARRSN